jgi:hypothetical protein
VRASLKGPKWYALGLDWQDRVVDERNWKIAIPPLWASLMEEFWTSYAQLYRVEPNRSALTNPYDIAPGGISSALRDLWAPTVDLSAQLAAQASAAASNALKAAKAAAVNKVKSALRAAGKEIAIGAGEQANKDATNWGAWAAGAGVLLAVGYYATQQKSGRRTGVAGFEGGPPRHSLPKHVGDTQTVSGHGRKLKIKKLSGTSWFAQLEDRKTHGRFGTAKQITEDVQHFRDYGTLPEGR